MKNKLILISLIWILLSCDEATLNQEFPVLIAKLPIVTSVGVELEAELLNKGTESLTDYGFVWSVSENPTIERDYYRSTSGSLEPGVFSMSITVGLTEGREYYVRPYARTSSYIVYGEQSSFISSGSNPPVITDFTPKSGDASEDIRLIITGNNFGFLPDDPESNSSIAVRLRNFNAVIESASNTQLVVTLPCCLLEQFAPSGVSVTYWNYGQAAIANEQFMIE